MSTSKLFCPIRRQWVANQPEEVVRQELLEQMLHKLGYPQEGIGVEKSLKQMPHLALTSTPLPSRRADIVCFCQGHPLLLIECKAVRWNSRAVSQVIGYNYYLGASAIALAAPEKFQLGLLKPQSGEYTFSEGLPSYPELIARCQA
ncbi:MAG: type I restriction enzyme HsdR N-terminal domain-containing protein [Chlamydiia bacterium]|nr:type I restriction enzyme HsdR N-terminal domain-containing protein [Chlamydiia bacterium]